MGREGEGATVAAEAEFDGAIVLVGICGLVIGCEGFAIGILVGIEKLIDDLQSGDGFARGRDWARMSDGSATAGSSLAGIGWARRKLGAGARAAAVAAIVVIE